jgi:hypothetical protein
MSLTLHLISFNKAHKTTNPQIINIILSLISFVYTPSHALSNLSSVPPLTAYLTSFFIKYKILTSVAECSEVLSNNQLHQYRIKNQCLGDCFHLSHNICSVFIICTITQCVTSSFWLSKKFHCCPCIRCSCPANISSDVYMKTKFIAGWNFYCRYQNIRPKPDTQLEVLYTSNFTSFRNKTPLELL